MKKASALVLVSILWSNFHFQFLGKGMGILFVDACTASHCLSDQYGGVIAECVSSRVVRVGQTWPK